MLDKVYAIYIFIDDLLQKIGHYEDNQVKVKDSEVLTIAIISFFYFGGHYEKTLGYVQSHKIFSVVLGKSRYCRRIHRLDELIGDIFMQLGYILKQFNTSKEYIMDSFPIAVCHNIRITNCKLLPKNELYRGKCVSKREYFYGIRIQMIVTTDGIPVEFAFVPGRISDVKGMNFLQYDLPDGSRNINDSAYTNYQFEDNLEYLNIWHDTVRKSNSKRREPSYRTYYKQVKRKLIETVFSLIQQKLPKKIHASSIKGFLLKVKLWILSFQLEKAFI
jgi:hypothetical protein